MSMAAGIRIRWSEVFKSLRAICGTIIPTKRTGPQYPVTGAERITAPASAESRARVRVGGLRDGDEEDGEGRRDPGEHAHAPLGPPRIDPVGHRLSPSASWSSARPRCGADRYAKRERSGRKTGGGATLCPVPACNDYDLFLSNRKVAHSFVE